MNNPQQPPPAQAQPGPIMRCCQKTNIRDCDCLRPQGPCQQPEFILTHYRDDCPCDSCRWVREARQEYVPNHLVPGSSHTLKNCTYAGHQVDHILNTETSIPNVPEHIYPVMVAVGPPQEWKFVIRPSSEHQVPYLAGRHQCPRTVVMVTLDSSGNWKGLSPGQPPVRIDHHTPPIHNTLYRDYGYGPVDSPYRNSSEFANRPDDMARTPAHFVPANRLRRFAADTTNTTLVIGNIDKSVSNDEIKWLLGNYGQIRYFNRPDQTCAFVQFALRCDALMAMRQLQGIPIYTRRLRIFWGNPTVKNQDEFEVREGPLRLKGTRYQSPPQQPPQQPKPMGGKPRPHFSLDPRAASFTPDRKGKGPASVGPGDCESNPSEQSHYTQPERTRRHTLIFGFLRTPSPQSQETGGGSSAKCSDGAAASSKPSGLTGPGEEAGPDQEGTK